MTKMAKGFLSALLLLSLTLTATDAQEKVENEKVGTMILKKRI